MNIPGFGNSWLIQFVKVDFFYAHALASLLGSLKFIQNIQLLMLVIKILLILIIIVLLSVLLYKKKWSNVMASYDTDFVVRKVIPVPSQCIRWKSC